ncbi:hypothetical protein A5N15_11705 [Rothia kristinae]|uniref:Uncharacterized protein n=1 Tax=Rothia kristinae TaxID=37923 RepID=A0A657IT08_9MICC|nr:hypothetical protein A5N15_11705 [Rothia kristinae]
MVGGHVPAGPDVGPFGGRGGLALSGLIELHTTPEAGPAEPSFDGEAGSMDFVQPAASPRLSTAAASATVRAAVCGPLAGIVYSPCSNA